MKGKKLAKNGEKGQNYHPLSPRRPDDIKVFGLVLFIIEVEDVTQMGWVELWDYIEAHNFTTRIGEYFGNALWKRLSKISRIRILSYPDGFIFGAGAVRVVFYDVYDLTQPS